MTQLNDARNALRRELRRARRQLTPAQQQRAAVQLLEQWQRHFHAVPGRVALYLANDGEVSLQPLLQWLQCNRAEITLPVLHPFSGNALLFQRYMNTTPMHLNRFGIEEPVLDCTAVRLVPQHDMILLPLVGFDAAGNRLGMGGGFYDRTLAGLIEADKRPLLLGVAHECQQVRNLPVESWDIPLDGILTPAGFISASSRILDANTKGHHI
ncbi:5-formyltetrahydrofolate cyclo-ligase [Alteromonas aestuariivivens]|uniref:5-formyltetrahydrofolate cyclo-ligase n=1 Tax=Alteromonas aestuariivivens TaxID=1938339 RepID=A0A3D8MEQ3_9ALTE|nr:5-formyltetrahydrofolate cyclo-ligase [Alteromonas aestuariivivens]RDV29096.1 5-formyltetrahydrofolate cyclo-ligase [Alteromonas aestuariivivens]